MDNYVGERNSTDMSQDKHYAAKGLDKWGVRTNTKRQRGGTNGESGQTQSGKRGGQMGLDKQY